jgi:hypothetical protein
MVAILTAAMRKTLLSLPLVLAVAMPAAAQQWSVGGGVGPFVFGKFATRTSALGTEQGTGTSTTSRLSAATRPGVAADVGRDFGRWLGVQFGASWTYAPLQLKASGSNAVTFEAGHIGVTTFSAPLVVHLNRGSFRFHLMGGPAYALYHGYRRTGGGGSDALFTGTRGRLGGIAGGGVTWRISNRFGFEGEVSDTITASPFHVEDIAPTAQGVRISRPQNVHTTVGVRYYF